jgi:GxxExxY protein
MARDELLYERLTGSIIGAFYEVYNRLGYGFLEAVYAKALQIELEFRGHKVQAEVNVDLYYRGRHLGRHRVDRIVDEKVVIEVKAAETMPKIAGRQCLSYLRVTSMQVGLALNFGCQPQIKRIQSSGAALGPDTAVVFHRDAGPDPGPASIARDIARRSESSKNEKSDQI